ncbi:MAG: YaaA family protein [Bacteroidales bacterium]|nr:YaaA family protein [Bacteroidales bacterium]
MFTLISPAKTAVQDNVPKCKIKTKTSPQMLDDARIIVDILKNKTPDQLVKILDCTYGTAENAKVFYTKFEQNIQSGKGCPAISCMEDFVRGVELLAWSAKDFDFIQEHLGIISSLYGFLRPCDIVGSYVLPPDTILHTERGRRITEFWKESLTSYVKKFLESRGETQIVNLMAAVPRREIDFSQMKVDVYEVSFMEIASTGNLHCTSSWRLNRLRANLVEFIAQNRVDTIDGLKDFDFEGFRYSPERSEERLIVYYKV